MERIYNGDKLGIKEKKGEKTGEDNGFKGSAGGSGGMHIERKLGI